MRFARDLPVLRQPIRNAPQYIQQLADRLIGLKDKHGILPVKLKDAIQAYHSPSEPIKDYMFTSERTDADTNTDDDSPDNGSLEQFDRLVEICDNTWKCETIGRNFYEVEWNETVHSPMLRLVTRGRRDLECRNLTQANISKRWTDPETPDSRIDYGVFAVPALDSDLYNRIFSYIQQHPGSQVNPLEDIDPDYPLAIIIETKQLAPGVEKADTQLASFARCLMRLTGEFTFAKDPQLIPLLKVVGSDWRLNFMTRENNRASLTILFTWAGRLSTDWWSSALSDEELRIATQSH
ncbi:hypothetical protein DL771_007582 [Monosporascus sp. 5C6A]|nr:hypothetical protein DL771_007582 [Monosporascus sp. 5C6A]